MSPVRFHFNRQRVLAEMRNVGQIGRADLAKRLGLSVQAVSNITDALLQQNLIRETGRREGGRGLPVVLYGLNPDGAHTLGFEIRPSALYVTLMDQTGEAPHQHRIPLTSATPDEVIGAITDHVDQLRQTYANLIGAGIVRPGPFGATGYPLSGNELPGWEMPDLDARFEQALEMHVTLDNDATAGASAEHQRACHGDDFAYLYFGTGLGLGIISGGKPLIGALGNSGEIGSLRLQGLTGRLEQHLSRSALQQAMAERDVTVDTIDDIARLHQQDNPDLDQWMAQAARALGIAMSTIENLFDPETIVLGGAMPAPVLQDLIDRCPVPTDTVAARPGRALPRLQLGICGPYTVSTGAAARIMNQHLQVLRFS